eukprot:5933160-Amphidinium_carterae.4
MRKKYISHGSSACCGPRQPNCDRALLSLQPHHRVTEAKCNDIILPRLNVFPTLQGLSQTSGAQVDYFLTVTST